MNTRPRVRFAPSPTGPLHMGGVRTALYNYLFAKKHGGDFILRIEDTDQNRFVEGAQEYILSALKWCGIEPNEGQGFGGSKGPYRQSERKDVYRQYADQLIASGNGYIAFDTSDALKAKRDDAEASGQNWQYSAATRSEMTNSTTLSPEDVKTRIDQGDPYVIRFKMPAQEDVTFIDVVRDSVTINTRVLDDKVLFKSDGLPTYHLANVVDDHLMEITHVIRGEEWLPSAPLHVLLYRALGWSDTTPSFAHLPLILKPTGKGKLSKRDGAKFGFPVFPLEWKDEQEGETYTGYREAGYMPAAFVNMLVMLGWNPGTEKELFSLDEMAEAFSLERVIKAGARFDPQKAEWFNQEHLKATANENLGADLVPLMAQKGHKISTEQGTQIAALLKERVTFLKDMVDADFLFAAPTSFDAKSVKKKWKEQTAGLMADLAQKLGAISNWNHETIETAFSELMEEKEVGFGQLGPGWRLCLTGMGGGPGLFEIAAFLGKEETLDRMTQSITKIEAQKAQA